MKTIKQKLLKMRHIKKRNQKYSKRKKRKARENFRDLWELSSIALPCKWSHRVGN